MVKIAFESREMLFLDILQIVTNEIYSYNMLNKIL